MMNDSENRAAVCFDDYGRPYILVREGQLQNQLTGPQTLRQHILAARQVAHMMRTSLGPKGMDKLLVTQDSEIVVTNDGATILALLDLENEVAKLMCELAAAQDREVGDGTTGVVVLAGALLERALDLLDKGVHPTRVADGYERAARRAAAHLDTIAFGVSVDAEDTTWLHRAAVTALGSKVASKCLDHLATVVVDAWKTTCDLNQPTPDVHLNSIVLRGKTGGQLEDTQLIRGIIVDKNFAHPQMKQVLDNVKVAVFTGTALQLPKALTRHQLNVTGPESYNEIKAHVDEWCENVVKRIVDAGAELVVFSGQIEEEILHSLVLHGISALDTVSEVDLVALSFGARLVGRMEDLTSDKVGIVERVRVIGFGTTKDKFVALEHCEGTPKVVTIFVRGSNQVVVDEVKRSIQDALCAVRNLTLEKAAVYGGGAAEISCSIALQEESLAIADVDQLAFQAFAEALEAIPLALADNCGLFPLQALTELKAGHKPWWGVECMGDGTGDMRALGVIEGLVAKKHQLTLSTQLARMVLKIDDVRSSHGTDKNK